jgi:hypothetical protein
VIDNDLRIQISSFRCAELVSSCALVQNGAAARPTPAAPTNPDSGGQANNTNIAKVQEAVSKAQAAYAAVSEAQAKVA